MEDPKSAPKEPTNPTQQFLDSIYSMFYRKDTTGLQCKHFRFLGNLKNARERAERHCTVMGAKLHYVQPFLTNLELEEDYHTGKLPVKPGLPSVEPPAKVA